MTAESVYWKSFEFARNHAEEIEWQNSFSKNVACRHFLETDGHQMDSRGLVEQAISNYGLERVKYVLAKTVQHRGLCPAFLMMHKRWASTYRFSSLDDREHRGLLIVLNSEPQDIAAMIEVVWDLEKDGIVKAG